MNSVVRPWNDEWQLWKSGKKAGAFVLEQSSSLEKLKLPGKVCCAIPARLVVAVPLWIEASDDETTREIARLEMEMKGLASGERLATDVEVEILRREEGRALVRATVYPSEWPDRLRAFNGTEYAPSPLAMAYGGDGVHVWREFDDLVAVVVWKDQVVCWETTHWPAEYTEIASWLRRLMIQLNDELGLYEPFLLKEWFGIFSEVPEPFRRSQLGDADREQGPPLKNGFFPGRWQPHAVKALHVERGKRQKFIRLAVGTVGVILCAAVAFFMVSLRLSQRISDRDREIARIESEIDPLRSIARQWMRVESALDRRFHPLEVLREAVVILPSSGVRLTVFQMSADRVLIEGEAENVSAATEYFSKLEQGSQSGLRWEMPPPALQPNNTAKFAIIGDRIDGQ